MQTKISLENEKKVLFCCWYFGHICLVGLYKESMKNIILNKYIAVSVAIARALALAIDLALTIA